jgi:hypothetical protein
MNFLNPTQFYASYLPELGGVSASPQGLVQFIIQASVGLGGIAATLLVVFGGITMLTSAGSAEKIQKGQQMVTNALIGLAVILMAVVLVKTAGIDILQLPGFGTYF